MIDSTLYMLGIMFIGCSVKVIAGLFSYAASTVEPPLFTEMTILQFSISFSDGNDG